jgi:hypothetical protein
MEETYYAKHREAILAKAKERREGNKEKYKQDYKTWYDLNKKELYERRKKRKALIPKPVKPPKPVKIVPVPVLSVIEPPVPVSRIEYVTHEIFVSFD